MTPAKRLLRSYDISSDRYRVLCVDDDQDTCEMLTAMLGISGLEAVAVPTAAEALRLMGAEKFSLYVIDGQMPDIGGFTFCEEIRRVDKDTPIVIFTGRALEADVEAGLRAGADAYVVKPDAEALVSTVKRLLGETRETSDGGG